MAENSSPDNKCRNDPPSADEKVAKLRLQLRHLSLEKLEEEGLVRRDRDEQIVKKGPKFYEKYPEQGYTEEQ